MWRSHPDGSARMARRYHNRSIRIAQSERSSVRGDAERGDLFRLGKQLANGFANNNEWKDGGSIQMIALGVTRSELGSGGESTLKQPMSKRRLELFYRKNSRDYQLYGRFGQHHAAPAHPAFSTTDLTRRTRMWEGG
ncbi:16396_t:CDS:2 [Acaulospora colombiana]|uniref:16396_t:CDS:1 n=1 Tax=Acaulospora colombiana TaxID=27376 RepID=A0ACA9PG10_9GLOM|nr:16396_t:CDS:2 [Acaulospora colombiana]